MEIILKSLAAAAVTAIILLIAKFSGPKLAGAIGGIPIVFVISYIFITLENRGSAKNFLLGGIIWAVAAIFFSIVLIFFNDKFSSHHWVNFIVAYVLCLLLTFGIVHFTSK